MSAFDTADMVAALNEATHGATVDATHGATVDTTNGDTNNSATSPITNEEAHKLARDAGWVAPEGYNYEAYNTNSGAAATASTEGAAGEGWAHSAVKYEWKEEYGEVGPEIPELEGQLFRSELINRQGMHLKNILSIKVTAEAEEKPAPIAKFSEAGLHPIMVKNIELCGYESPTPIQAYTIPAVLQGHDLIATAQTGSGKTAAFLIPCISKIVGKVKKLAAPRPSLANGFNADEDRVRAEPLILIVAPTRELCCQIFDESRRMCYRSMLRPCVAYGGGPVRDQLEELAKGCDILIATPGRLLDFMGRSHVMSLSRVRFTIVDEADEMLHDDWEEEMSKIMAGGDINEDGDHRYLLFSATFSKDMRKLAKKYLANDHVRIRIGRAGATHVNVKQQVIFVENNAKKKALYDLLISMPPSRTLVFVQSKKTADFVDDYLFNLGLPSTSIHSDRTQREREDALRAFRSGKCPILVATGVSGRGLDIRNVMHVINYDLPNIDHNGKDEYIHRIGRTARIGNEGLATSFFNERDEPIADFLIKILLETNQELPDFWADRKPAAGEPLDFEDDSGDEEEDDTAAGEDGNGDAWGAGGNANTNGDENGGTWGAGGDSNANEGSAWGAADATAIPIESPASVW